MILFLLCIIYVVGMPVYGIHVLKQLITERVKMGRVPEWEIDRLRKEAAVRAILWPILLLSTAIQDIFIWFSKWLLKKVNLTQIFENNHVQNEIQTNGPVKNKRRSKKRV